MKNIVLNDDFYYGLTIDTLLIACCVTHFNVPNLLEHCLNLD